MAVTLAVAAPFPSARSVTVAPAAERTVTAESEEAPANRSESPSGSAKYAIMPNRTESPRKSSWSAMESETTGDRFGTMTSKVCETERPAGSVATTVALVLPEATASIATVPPETDTVATEAAEEVASKVSASPSGSLKYGARPNVTESPRKSSWPGMLPIETGASFESHPAAHSAAASAKV